MSRFAKQCALVVVGCLMLVGTSAVHAEFIIDDFAAPGAATVPVIGLLDASPYHLETGSAAILGGERDLLLEVMGTPSPSSFIGEIGGGSLKFSSSSPGTMLALQYDGVDTDTAGPPAALVNAQGLGGVDLTAMGSAISLMFGEVDGGSSQTTDISIEVRSSTGTSTLAGTIADSAGATKYMAPFASFSDPSVFADVTAVEVLINAGGAKNVDLTLDAIVVPEPSALLLLASGLIALLGYAWRRR